MTLNFRSYSLALFASALLLGASSAVLSADAGSVPVTANAVITVKPARANAEAKTLGSNEVVAYTGKNRAQVTALERLQGDQAGMQLFIFLDDSTRSGALGTKIPELKLFVRSLPPSTQVAIGYMRNGGFDLVQGFTDDHSTAAESIRLPQSTPGINGSPYFALSYLVKHWPAKEQTGRRAVLMLTDGVDRYYTSRSNDDPYVAAAIKDSQHLGVLVYSIYMRGEGLFGRGGWTVNMAQSRLDQVSKATGGEAYFEGFTTPVSLMPYLKQFEQRLNNQYRVTFVADKNSGLERVEFRSELPGVKIIAPQQVFVKDSHS
jgi:hypothetical protein